ncbi:hypothetical protein [Aminobacter aminovorans]|uniref:hypothetical protein n=1 Tax=Aminobacter aminovorans TaxID=83263 RepID=UPI00286136F6|nr:hypothetical protein [Aminobacter aminovorans]MDR7220355.1 MoxR-like ATPase [Aminobacter aminovorans]
MAHVRKQVRSWVKGNLMGSTAAGGRVFVSRTNPLPDALQPTLLIAVQNERSADVSAQGSQRRDIAVRVTACAKGDAEATEDTLDQLAVFVESVFAADPTLGGLAETYEYQSTEFEFNGSGEKTLCTAALTFAVTLFTARTDPETSI